MGFFYEPIIVFVIFYFMIVDVKNITYYVENISIIKNI